MLKTQASTSKGQVETKTKISQKSSITKRKSKKVKVRLTQGRAYIQSTYNNTIVTITDLNGNVIAWGAAGILGFKGAKRATPYAATEIVKYVVDKVKHTGLKDINVFVRGVGSGRESAIRALNTFGLNVLSIKDVTPIPHNGCRPPKVRRV